MSRTVILVEADLVSPLGVAVTLRFSDRAIAPMAPDDADRPNAVWSDRLIEPPTLKRMLFDDLQSLEPGLGVGTLVLANADGGLDAYESYVWGEVRVWRWTVGQAFSTALPLMTGPAAGTPSRDVQTRSPSRVRLTLFDYRLELERPIQTATLQGTNDVDGDIYFEGDASLRGRLKPLAYGNLLTAHIPAPLVNAYVSAYQLHDGPIAETHVGGYELQIYDRGGPAGLVFGNDLTGEIETDEEFYYEALYPEVEDNPFDPVPPGDVPPEPDPEAPPLEPRWQAWTERGLLKLNGQLVGEIACGIAGDVTGGTYVETPGPIIARLLARAGVPAERIGASVASATCDSVMGLYVPAGGTAREIIGFVARSAPLAILPDRMGVWQAVPFAAPAEVADFTLIGDEIIQLEADDSAPRGAGEFIVGWDRIWTTYRRESLQAELQGTAAETRLAEPYRYSTLEDAAFKARYPSAWQTMKVDSALRYEADADALAETFQGLFGLRADGRPRRQWRVTIEMTDTVLALPLGSTVSIQAPDFGVEDHFLLIGEEPMRPRRDFIVWTLWG